MTHDPARDRSEEVTVRLAHEGDFDALTELWERATRSSHGFLSADDVAEGAPWIRDALLPSMQVWLAEDARRRPLGFVGARGTHVELLYVEPDAQGGGIGTLLLDLVGEPPEGATSVEIYAENAVGRAFYTARGFEAVRTSPTDAFGRPHPVVQLVRGPTAGRQG